MAPRNATAALPESTNKMRVLKIAQHAVKANSMRTREDLLVEAARPARSMTKWAKKHAKVANWVERSPRWGKLGAKNALSDVRGLSSAWWIASIASQAPSPSPTALQTARNAQQARLRSFKVQCFFLFFFIRERRHQR